MYTNFLEKKMVMYKIDRRGGRGGVQKSFSRTDPEIGPNDPIAKLRKLLNKATVAVALTL